MQISPHFDDSEFECPCGCGFKEVHRDLLEILERIRAWYDSPVVITSGCRCHKHNKTIPNAVSKSQHVFGLAADFKVIGVNSDQLYDDIDHTFPDKFGLGRYPGRVHLDVRKNGARWEG